jgi:hypothetical protein
MQRIDLRSALAMILEADLGREIEQRVEARLKVGPVGNLAANIADDAAEARAQELQRPPHPLELMRVGVTPDHDGRPLTDAQIALAQRHTLGLGEADQLLQGPMHQPRIRRMRDGLGLHGRVHDDSFQVLRLDRAGLVRDREALLDQRHERLLAQPLPPACQRRAVEGELVAEAQRAAEVVLVIGILEPARAQRLVREVVHVLQDEEPGHEPRQQTGMARPRRTDRSKALIEKAPIDLACEPRQRVTQIDDLIQRGPQQILLPLVARSRHPCVSMPKTFPPENHDPPKTEEASSQKSLLAPCVRFECLHNLAKPFERVPFAGVID